jgi:hypothetical protein
MKKITVLTLIVLLCASVAAYAHCGHCPGDMAEEHAMAADHMHDEVAQEMAEVADQCPECAKLDGMCSACKAKAEAAEKMGVAACGMEKGSEQCVACAKLGEMCPQCKAKGACAIAN